MRFTIPVLVEELAGDAAGGKGFHARPLFHPEPEVRAARVERALNLLTAKLHQELDAAGRQARHDALAEWSYLPLLREVSVNLRLELDSGSFPCRPFFICCAGLGRELCHTPLALEVVFELPPGGSLEERALAVLTRHFRQRERRGDFQPELLSRPRRHRVVTLELEVEPALRLKAPPAPTRALLFGSLEEFDGKRELRKTGLALHEQHPDGLERAVGREAIVTELTRLLVGGDRRSAWCCLTKSRRPRRKCSTCCWACSTKAGSPTGLGASRRAAARSS